MALLELHDVHRDFGGVHAVDGISVTLDAGELRALVGPNGCGKSTLFNLITGALAPSAGSIRFGGREIGALAPHRIAQLGIARKFQVATVFDELTVAENVALAARRPTSQALARTGLAARRDALAGTLSHGERQWLELAMVLAQAPRLVLLDEPTAGMTAAETDATVTLIRDIAATGDVATWVIEHDVAFLERLACPVTVMARGRIVRTGTVSEIRSDAAVQALYFGGAA